MPEDEARERWIDRDLAHDLTNVLAAALASARLVARRTQARDAADLATTTLRQIEKALAMIHDAS